MSTGSNVDKCKYWPQPEDDLGGVCGCGSEIGGNPCTKEDEKECQWAKEREHADKETRRIKAIDHYSRRKRSAPKEVMGDR